MLIFPIIIVRYALDRPTFYAKLLHFAIAGPGTKDATLQRVLAMRADVSSIVSVANLRF